MASYFRVFWRKGRRLQGLPEFNEPPPAAPAGEPVSAWTPYFKRTDNTTNRRTPEESPHNPAHPATPLPPFVITAAVAATSIKRRDIRRQRIPSPFHYDKPLTTRITHLTANVLYGQGPPTARITHVTASVLYRRPTSQGNPETNPAKKGQKKKWGYVTGDTSTARRLLRLQPLDVFQPTPPGFFAGQIPAFIPSGFFQTSFKRSLITPLEIDEYPPPPVSVVAETPALTANFSEFRRQIQTLELNEYPETPIPTIPFAALDLLLEAHLVEFNRQIQKLPQLDERPPTPPRFFEGFFPAAVRLKRIPSTYGRESQVPLELDERPATPPGFRWPRPPMPTHKVAFTRKLQTLAHNPAYPPTPPRFFEGFFPAAVRLKRIPSAYHRESQVPLELDERPPTPPGFFEGHWPAPVPFPTFKVSFDRTLQAIPELDRYKPPPVSDENYGGYTPVLTFRVSFTRTLQVLGNPHVYPATPPGFRWPRPPMPTLTASFERQIQSLELNEYPPPPVSADDYPALTPALKANRSEFKRTLQTLELNEYPETPPGFFEGFFPAPIRLKRIPTTYGREAQVPLELDERPATPAGFRWPRPPPASFKVSFDRKLQLPLEIDEYPPPPVSAEDYGGYTPVPKHTQSFTRSLQALGNPHVYPATPAGFFDGFYPGSGSVTANRTDFTRRLQSLPELDERPLAPAAPPPQPVVVAFSVSFTRNRRALNHNPTYPPTPAGFFDGFWPANKRVEAYSDWHNPARKVSFKRKLQPTLIAHVFPAIPPVPVVTSWTRAIESYSTDFDRVALTWPVHNEYPETPPSIIEGMAPWAMQSIYRRDIKRTMQPSWDPSAGIPELFVSGLVACWRADPIYLVWKAGCADTTWKADPFCG